MASKKFNNNIGINNIVDKRNKDQDFVDRATNSKRNTPDRTQPFEVANKMKTIQFRTKPDKGILTLDKEEDR